MSQTTPINQFPGSESTASTFNRIFGLSQVVNGGIDAGESTQTGATANDEYTGNLNGQPWIVSGGAERFSHKC